MKPDFPTYTIHSLRVTGQTRIHSLRVNRYLVSLFKSETKFNSLFKIDYLVTLLVNSLFSRSIITLFPLFFQSLQTHCVFTLQDRNGKTHSLFKSETKFPHVQYTFFKGETKFPHVQNSLFKSETKFPHVQNSLFKSETKFSPRTKFTL